MRLVPFILSLTALHLPFIEARKVSLPERDQDLPGWDGEAGFEGESSEVRLGKEDWHGEILQLSWSPRAFLLKGFLSGDECDHLISLATPSMSKSTVADNATGKRVDSDVRTSTGTFLETKQGEIVSDIEKRVAQVTMIPEPNQESMQILHYDSGQMYLPHHDYFTDAYNKRPQRGGQRIATVLMYLTTPEEGGETVFPDAERKVEGPEWSDCAQGGLAVKATRGDAVMFFSLKPDGTEDPASLHGSCPTTKGDKWSATKWIRVDGIGGQSVQAEMEALFRSKSSGEVSSACNDRDRECEEWADTGECAANAPYMRLYCPKSCKLC